jgi:hypothetical protein
MGPDCPRYKVSLAHVERRSCDRIALVEDLLSMRSRTAQAPVWSLCSQRQWNEVYRRLSVFFTIGHPKSLSLFFSRLNIFYTTTPYASIPPYGMGYALCSAG